MHVIKWGLKIAFCYIIESVGFKGS